MLLYLTHICDHLTRMVTRDNKHECLKGVMEGQKLMLILAAIATQIQREHIKGALALASFWLNN